MQCRNALRQHAPGRARPRLSQTDNIDQYIWTSDAILAEAFARFVQVSRARRRYESRVPGPLESRRRLAKRQYGLTNVSASSSVNPALFGDYSVLDNTGIYKWQPPTPHAKLKNVKAVSRDGSESWWPSWLDDLSQKEDLELSEKHQQGSQEKISTSKEQDSIASALLSENVQDEKPGFITETSKIMSMLSENEANLHDAQVTTSDINTVAQTKRDAETDASVTSTDEKSKRASHPQLDALFDNLKHIHHLDMLALQDILSFMSSTQDHAKFSSWKRLFTDYLPMHSIDEDAFETLCNTMTTKWEESRIYARDLALILKSLHQVVDCRKNPNLYDAILRLCERVARHLPTAKISPRYHRVVRAAVYFAAEPREHLGSVDLEGILFACKIFKLLARSSALTHHDFTLASSLARLLAKIPNDGNSIKIENESDKEKIVDAITSVVDESTNYTLLTAVVRHFMTKEAAIIRDFVVDGESKIRDQYCDSTIARINFWLRCAHNSKFLMEEHPGSKHSWAIYQEIAKHFEPGDLRQLNWLSKQHLALALLAGWTGNNAVTQVQQRKGQQLEGQQSEGQQMEGQQMEGQQMEGQQMEGQQMEGQQMEGQQMEGQQMEDQQVGDQQISDPELSLTNFATLHSRLDATRSRLFKKILRLPAYQDAKAIPHLLRGLSENDPDYNTILTHMVEATTWSTVFRYKIVEQLMTLQDITISEDLIISMMRQLTALQHYHLALGLVERLTLDSLPKLSDFIKILSTIQDFAMIIRTLDEALMRRKCDVSLIKGFVEQLALAIAENNKLDEQKAFRHVFVCHSFSQAIRQTWPSSGNDSGSHIARAFIQTAVIQRVQQGKYLSQDRIRYILDQIRLLEGEELAAELEQVLHVLQETLVQKHMNAELPLRTEEHSHYVPPFAKKLTVEDFLAPIETHERPASNIRAKLESMSPEADIRSVAEEGAAKSEEISSYRPMIRDILQLEELSDFDLIEPKHADDLPSRQ